MHGAMAGRDGLVPRLRVPAAVFVSGNCAAHLECVALHPAVGVLSTRNTALAISHLHLIETRCQLFTASPSPPLLYKVLRSSRHPPMLCS
jgi:hypothetical protein